MINKGYKASLDLKTFSRQLLIVVVRIEKS